MKRKMFAMLTVLLSVGLFSACSSDDKEEIDDKQEYPELDGTYSADGKDGELELYYGDALMLGQTVTFKITDETSGVMTLNNIIPGEKTTEFNVTLTEMGREGEGKYQFEGKNEKNGRTVTYKGTIAKGNLSLSLDVKLDRQDIMGIWGLNPQNPVHLAWEFNEEGAALDPEELEEVAEMLSGLLAGVLQTVTFEQSGDIRADYFDEDASDFILSPANLAHYYVQDNKAYVLLNTAGIIAQLSSRAVNQGGIEYMLENGFPVNYKVEDGNLNVFVDQAFVIGILGDELVQDLLDGVLSSIDNEDILELIEDAIKDLKMMFENTTKLEIGLNMLAVATVQ